jgi:transposase
VIDDQPGLLARGGAPDARSLSPQARAELRREVVVAVRGGMTRLEAARRFGVSRRTVGIWMRAYQTTGSEIIRERPRGRPMAVQAILTPDQELAVLRLLRAADPSFFGFDGHLWTRRTVTELIAIETGHRLGVPTVDHYLRRWQLTSTAHSEAERRTLRLSCHGISLPDARSGGPPRQTEVIWPALVAEARLGGVHFRLPSGPVGLDVARAFGRHLAQQSPRPIRLLVWRWPDAGLDVLRAWQADPGPGLTVELN